jgi:hypothetical protein
MPAVGSHLQFGLVVIHKVGLKHFLATVYPLLKTMLKVVSVSNPPTTRIIGAALAVLHSLAFLAFVAYLHQSQDGQAILLWAIWVPVDFPVSLAALAGFELLPSDGSLGSAFRRALPYLVHGLLGPIWWYFLPFLMKAAYDRVAACVLSRNDR